jgi:hypothetical protein
VDDGQRGGGNGPSAGRPPALDDLLAQAMAALKQTREVLNAVERGLGASPPASVDVFAALHTTALMAAISAMLLYGAVHAYSSGGLGMSAFESRFGSRDDGASFAARLLPEDGS